MLLALGCVGELRLHFIKPAEKLELDLSMP
jgi:hypothetical protein